MKNQTKLLPRVLQIQGLARIRKRNEMHIKKAFEKFKENTVVTETEDGVVIEFTGDDDLKLEMSKSQYAELLENMQKPEMWIVDNKLHATSWKGPKFTFPHTRSNRRTFEELVAWVKSFGDVDELEVEPNESLNRSKIAYAYGLGKAIFKMWFKSLPRLDPLRYYAKKMMLYNVRVRYEHIGAEPGVSYFHYDNFVPNKLLDPGQGLSLSMSFCKSTELCGTLYKKNLAYLNIEKLTNNMKPGADLTDLNIILSEIYRYRRTYQSKQWEISNIPSHALHASPSGIDSDRVFVLVELDTEE